MWLKAQTLSPKPVNYMVSASLLYSFSGKPFPQRKHPWTKLKHGDDQFPYEYMPLLPHA